MKNSFVMYTDYREQLELLSMEQRGYLLTAIMAYVAGDELPALDAVTQMAYTFIRATIDRDNDKYERTIEARKIAGRQGGRPRADSEKAKKANGFSEKQTKAKKANGFFEKQNNPDNDNESVNDNDNVNDNESESVNDNESDIKGGKPPTRAQMREYVREHHINIDADRVFDYYESQHWIKVNGKPVTDWRACCRAWAARETMRDGPNNNRFCQFPQRSYDWDEMERQMIGRG